MADWAEQYRLLGEDWVDKDAAASLLEETKTTFLNRRKSDLGDIADNKAERIVKSSPEWEDYVTKMVEARRIANLAKIHLEVVRMRYFKEQGENANARTEMRMLS